MHGIVASKRAPLGLGEGHGSACTRPKHGCICIPTDSSIDLLKSCAVGRATQNCSGIWYRASIIHTLTLDLIRYVHRL